MPISYWSSKESECYSKCVKKLFLPTNGIGEQEKRKGEKAKQNIAKGDFL